MEEDRTEHTLEEEEVIRGIRGIVVVGAAREVVMEAVVVVVVTAAVADEVEVGALKALYSVLEYDMESCCDRVYDEQSTFTRLSPHIRSCSR